MFNEKKWLTSEGDGAGVEFHGFLHNAYITGQKKAREVLDKLGVRHWAEMV